MASATRAWHRPGFGVKSPYPCGPGGAHVCPRRPAARRSLRRRPGAGRAGSWRATTLDPEVATVVIGEPRILARGQAIAGAAVEVPEIERLDELDGAGPALLPGPPIDPADAPIGEVSAVAGKAVLDTFRLALGLAQAGELDAICFAPCNKQAMHQGGLELEDELRFFVEVLGFKGHVGEVNATDQLATTRVTSHVPLRAVADLITEDARAAGDPPRPRHAARGRQAAPADRRRRPQPARRRRRHLRPRGDRRDRAGGRARPGRADRRVRPLPLGHRVPAGARRRVRRGGHDVPRPGPDRDEAPGLRARHHDPRRPAVPDHHAAHGTAFDIAGQGVARDAGLRQAYHMACRMAQARRRS